MRSDASRNGLLFEFLFLAFRQLSSSELTRVFHTGAFDVIISNWKKSKNSAGTQRGSDAPGFNLVGKKCLLRDRCIAPHVNGNKGTARGDYNILRKPHGQQPPGPSVDCHRLTTPSYDKGTKRAHVPRMNPASRARGRCHCFGPRIRGAPRAGGQGFAEGRTHVAGCLHSMVQYTG